MSVLNNIANEKMSVVSGPQARASRCTLLKVVILGDGGVGKSCLMNRFTANRFDENSFRTIGVEFMNKNIAINNESYSLQIWDTAGQERFKTLRTPFYRGSDICILCYAVDDKNSYYNLKNWMDEFLLFSDLKNDKQNTHPFIVVGNKSDVPESEREVTVEQLGQWCEEHNVPAYVETSAKDSSNVAEAFTLAVQRWLALDRIAQSEVSAACLIDSVKLNTKSERTSYSCCSRT